MVVTVGIDVHKQTHCAVAVDEAGRQLAQPLTVRATDAGHRQLLRWAGREFAPQTVEFAVEDCRHVSTRLERALLDAGASVVRVPPKLMAQTRTSARTRGKAGLQNRLRWHLHELDPELDPPARGLDLARHLDRLRARLEVLPASTTRRIALEELADIRQLTGRINGLEKELAVLVRAQAPQLLTLPGCGVLTAAKLLGETADPARFRSEACFAMHAGVAPIPASSGKTSRHRLARGGNRQLNAALHRIAVTQIRLDGLGRTYYQRRRAQGNTTMEALRALKRRLARVVFNLLRPTDQLAVAPLPQAA
jgi:transposase